MYNYRLIAVKSIR